MRRKLPRIEYNWWQKVDKEEVFTENEKMRAFSAANQQDDNPCTQTLPTSLHQHESAAIHYNRISILTTIHELFRQNSRLKGR